MLTTDQNAHGFGGGARRAEGVRGSLAVPYQIHDNSVTGYTVLYREWLY